MDSTDIANVAILNMHYTGLGIARDLNGSGLSAYGLSFNDSFLGNATRHCTYVKYPNPLDDAEACLGFLVDFSRRLEGPTLLLATRDIDIEFIVRNWSELQRCFVLPWPGAEVLNRILDKSSLAGIARRAGVHCPATIRVTNRADLATVRIGMPCIVKPERAADWRRPGVWELVGRRKVAICHSKEEVEKLCSAVSGLGVPLLIQEFIPGDDSSLVMFGSCRSRDGRLVYYTSQKLLQDPPFSGTGVAVRSRPVPEVVERSRKLLAELGYWGVSEIEYKYDPRVGDHALIEVNPRHWDQHQLGTVSGVNLTLALCATLRGRPLPDFQQGAKRRTWIAEDAFVLALLRRLRNPGYRWRSYLAALLVRPHFVAFRLTDMRPFGRMLANLVRLLHERMRSSTRGS